MFSNTVSAQTIESIPAGLSQKEVTPRGLVSLPAGTYYCLSTGRSDSYINISTDGISCTFNNVYSTEKIHLCQEVVNIHIQQVHRLRFI